VALPGVRVSAKSTSITLYAFEGKKRRGRETVAKEPSSNYGAAVAGTGTSTTLPSLLGLDHEGQSVPNTWTMGVYNVAALPVALFRVFVFSLMVV
jgi:hypothetical protein